MAGELRLSQFRWTTTADDDLCIGNPGAASTATKYLVFQTNDNPDPTQQPRLSCIHSGGSPGNWSFTMTSTVAGTPVETILSGMAYLTANQTFSGNNTFSGANPLTGSLVLTSPNGRILFGTGGTSGSIYASGDAAFNSLNVNNVFSVNTTGDVATNNTTVVGSLVLKYSLAVGTTFVTSANNVSLNLPSSSGTLALTSNLVDLTTDQLIAGNKTFSETTYFSTVINTGAYIAPTGDAWLKNITLHGDSDVANISDLWYFTGGMVGGSILGCTLPANLSGSTGQVLVKNSSTFAWDDVLRTSDDNVSTGAQSLKKQTWLFGSTSVNVSGGSTNAETSYDVRHGYSSWSYGTFPASIFTSAAYFKMGSFGNVVGQLSMKYFAGVPSAIEYGSIQFNTTYMQFFPTSDTNNYAKLTCASSETILELAGANSSAIILVDQTSHTKYKLYVDSGVLHLALAP